MPRQMRELQLRYRTALHEQRLFHEEVALKARLSPNSLRNIINGVRASKETRRRITAACGKQLWDDMPLEFRFVFEPGDKITSPTIAQSVQTEQTFSEFVNRHGRVVTFIKPTHFILYHPPSAAEPGISDRQLHQLWRQTPLSAWRHLKPHEGQLISKIQTNQHL